MKKSIHEHQIHGNNKNNFCPENTWKLDEFGQRNDGSAVVETAVLRIFTFFLMYIILQSEKFNCKLY